MSEVKITTLSPIHISSGNEYELNFNSLQSGEFIYLYDEFKIAEFFINNNILIPSNFNELKSLIKSKKEQIIRSNLHKRRVVNKFDINKTVLEQVNSASEPIITGSSLKGAIRTAYIYKMVKDGIFKKEKEELQKIDDMMEEASYDQKNDLFKQKKKLKKDIEKKITNKTKSVFKYLKISDTLEEFNTKIIKTINIKKEKSHQKNRSKKVESLSNFVESIAEGQNNSFVLNIEDDYFKNCASVCNEYYQKLYNVDFDYYFANHSLKRELNLNKNKFLLNIGRFGGAEKKSIEVIRSLNKTGAEVDFETSAVTFGLDLDNGKPPYFENELVPFGWILCEII